VSEYALADLAPRLGRRVCIAPSAAVIGDAELGDESNVRFGVGICGDETAARIGAASNFLDAVGAAVLGDAIVASRALVAIGAPWTGAPAARRRAVSPPSDRW
jgi:hypothetical protein